MSKPLYLVIYESLKGQISSGVFKFGERLPTDKELGIKYQVSNITIKKAMDLLNNDGLISRKPRRGTVVIKPLIRESFITESLETREQKSSTFKIGVVFTQITDAFGNDILSSIVQEAEKKAEIILKLSFGSETIENEIIAQLIEDSVDGIIILPVNSKYISPNLLTLISKNFPLVILDRVMPNLPICSIASNNVDAAENATKILFDMGHTNICIVSAKNSLSTITNRIKGFERAYLKANMLLSKNYNYHFLESVIPGSTVPIEHDINNFKEFILKRNYFTAFIANEYNAALIIKQSINLLGRTVPKDYSIICFDHAKNYIFDNTAFVFNHIEQNQYLIGSEAVKILLKKINDKLFISNIVIPSKYIKGNSVIRISK